MERMSELLAEGGRCIYVAPSGGRDRPNAVGVVEVAAFDPQSIEMFYLMAGRAGRSTHFYPMALATYAFLPPPETVRTEMGEARHITRTGIHMAVGTEVNMEHYPGSELPHRHERRTARATHIWQQVCDDYAAITR
jgi:glycerol-3-phosphate O-acyltransferase